MATSNPRYLRFARALALLSASTQVSGCYLSHGLEESGSRDAGIDAPIVAADVPTEDVDVCTTCECDEPWGTPRPGTCQDLGHWLCCAIIGPLSPPSLPA